MIYSISDVHGDLKRVIKLLQEYDVIDEDHNWSAGSSVLVVNGDSTDRGPDGIGVLKLFYKLTQEAKLKGGTVIHTMGNHDALILSVTLEHVNDYYDSEHTQIFAGNGGKMHEAKSLATLHHLRRYIQSFPLMCRVDDVLFQHADGFDFYLQATQDHQEPEQMIAAVNAHGRLLASTAQGAWDMFYHMTDERYWNGDEQRMAAYLQLFGANKLAHGHTGFLGDEPHFYLDNRVINTDAVMSSGYRKDENRGCVLVLDKQGTNIVI